MIIYMFNGKEEHIKRLAEALKFQNQMKKDNLTLKQD